LAQRVIGETAPIPTQTNKQKKEAGLGSCRVHGPSPRKSPANAAGKRAPVTIKGYFIKLAEEQLARANPGGAYPGVKPQTEAGRMGGWLNISVETIGRPAA